MAPTLTPDNRMSFMVNLLPSHFEQHQCCQLQSQLIWPTHDPSQSKHQLQRFMNLKPLKSIILLKELSAHGQSFETVFTFTYLCWYNHHVITIFKQKLVLQYCKSSIRIYGKF